MSERARQRQQAADDSTREHAEDQLAGRNGPGTAAAWTVELLIAAVIGLIVYLLGTGTAAVPGGAIWLAVAAIGMYAVRIKRRQRQGTRPSE